MTKDKIPESGEVNYVNNQDLQKMWIMEELNIYRFRKSQQK